MRGKFSENPNTLQIRFRRSLKDFLAYKVEFVGSDNAFVLFEYSVVFLYDTLKSLHTLVTFRGVQVD